MVTSACPSRRLAPWPRVVEWPGVSVEVRLFFSSVWPLWAGVFVVSTHHDFSAFFSHSRSCPCPFKSLFDLCRPNFCSLFVFSPSAKLFCIPSPVTLSTVYSVFVLSAHYLHNLTLVSPVTPLHDNHILDHLNKIMHHIFWIILFIIRNSADTIFISLLLECNNFTYS